MPVAVKYRAALIPASVVVAILLALAAILFGPAAARGQSGGPTVTGVAVSSDAGGDNTYAKGDIIQVTLTFSEAVNISGSPRVAIDMDPAEWGTKQAAYHRGSGTASLTFRESLEKSRYLDKVRASSF